MVGLTGCAGNRYHQTTGHRTDDNRTAEPGYNQSTARRIDSNRTAEPGSVQSSDQSIEDRRTAERVREALAASGDYKYDGVKVIASNGVVQLSGVVNTSAQRNSAGEVTRKVVGVKDVVNSITVKE